MYQFSMFNNFSLSFNQFTVSFCSSIPTYDINTISEQHKQDLILSTRFQDPLAEYYLTMYVFVGIQKPLNNSKTLTADYLFIQNQYTCRYHKFIKQAYEELVPEQHRPLENMVDPQNLQKLVQKLRIFVKSGIQLRILVEKDSYKLAKETLELLINCEQILQVTIESQQRINLIKSKKITSLKKLFEDQIKRLIKISTKKKVSLQYNFISMEAQSAEISHRRILLQQCVKTKQPYEYLQTHKKFAKMMENYQNQACLLRIDEIIQQKSSSRQKTLEINQQKQKIKRIQKQQQEFCKQFETYLSKPQPIQLQTDYKQILFKLIEIYKEQTSIYEVINTNLRLSINVNQTNMKCLSTMIRYLYEGIRYFFILLRDRFQYTVVYRGCRMSHEEFQLLENGTIVRNLGFMSTSWEERIATSPRFLPTDGSGCLLIIDIGKQQIESEEDQQGFACIPHIYKQMSKKQNKFQDQKEVLFNPLNIFEVVKTESVIKIDRDKKTEYNAKIVHLRYSPHIRLANKIKSNTITPQELKKYNSIKFHRTSFTRTSSLNSQSNIEPFNNPQPLSIAQRYQLPTENFFDVSLDIIFGFFRQSQ